MGLRIINALSSKTADIGGTRKKIANHLLIASSPNILHHTLAEAIVPGCVAARFESILDMSPKAPRLRNQNDFWFHLLFELRFDLAQHSHPNELR